MTHFHILSHPGVDVSKAPYKANKGCPCTPQQICTLPEFADVFHGACDIPRHPQRTYSMHGGSGAIISVGLLRRVGLQFVEDCIKGDISTGACKHDWRCSASRASCPHHDVA